MSESIRKKIFNYGGSFFGAFLFVVGINIIIVPHGLYSGTLTGVAQMIESLLLRYTALQLPDTYNLTGTVLLLLNIPLLVLVLKFTSRSFPVKSIINIVFMTTIMSFIPIPSEPIIYNILTASLVGGALAGFGIGFTLRCGGSTGGSDFIGIYCSAKYPNFTVGKVALIISSIVYTYCLFFYDFNIVIYSAIFNVTYSFVLDHIHYQNIKTSAFIFSDKPDAINGVVEQLGRGATCWEGKSPYSGQKKFIFATVVSKYEVSQLKRIVADVDPTAFIIFNNKVGVEGNFVKRL